MSPDPHRRIQVRVKRAYQPPAASDGYRVLVDRLWPRGLSRPEAAIDKWAQELAPSAALRRWFAHDAERFAEFRRRYMAELAEQRPRLRWLRRRARPRQVTLLYSARDEEHNQAVVLAEVLRRGIPRGEMEGTGR